MVTTEAGEPVVTSRLTDFVALQIATRIVRGEFSEGEPLVSEVRLAIAQGVSKPVVREALRELAAAGFVRVQHGKRTVVRRAADWDVLDPLIQQAYAAAGRGDELAAELHELRLILETSSAERAAARATTSQRALLTSIVEQLEEAARDEDAVGFLRADREFHEVLAQASGNQPLRQMIRNVHAFLASAWARSSVSVGELRALAEAHAAIAAAVIAADQEQARAAMQNHLEMAYRARLDTIHPEGNHGNDQL